MLSYALSADCETNNFWPLRPLPKYSLQPTLEPKENH